MTNPTTVCAECGITADELQPWGALVVSWAVWGKRRIVWAECLPCTRKSLSDKQRSAE